MSLDRRSFLKRLVLGTAAVTLAAKLRIAPEAPKTTLQGLGVEVTPEMEAAIQPYLEVQRKLFEALDAMPPIQWSKTIGYSVQESYQACGAEASHREYEQWLERTRRQIARHVGIPREKLFGPTDRV